MNTTEKICIFLPVHPKCKSLNEEILSLSYNFRELRLESRTCWPLGDARELAEGGLTQVAVDAKEETTGRAQEVFSRTVLHFGAASYSVISKRTQVGFLSTASAYSPIPSSKGEPGWGIYLPGQFANHVPLPPLLEETGLPVFCSV